MSTNISITTPELLLEPHKVKRNIQRMSRRAQEIGVELVPHFKTHQSLLVGRWLKDEGVKKINVSSVRMAQYFASDGWTDITIAFPANPLQAQAYNQLANDVNLTLFVNSAETAQKLDQKLEEDVRIYVEIDTGYRRSGVPTYDIDRLNNLMDALDQARHLHFEGFYCHNGQTYEARDEQEIQEIHNKNLESLLKIKERWTKRGLSVKLSVGDTPSTSKASQFGGIDSIRPGNFVFYDLMQNNIGSCNVEDIGVALACPVVELHRERSEIIVHGGAVHLSKEQLKLRDDTACYGKPVWLKDDSWTTPWPDSNLRACSQEHGVLRAPRAHLDLIEVGDIIGILPVHSCLTAHAMRGYRLPDGSHADHLEGTQFTQD